MKLRLSGRQIQGLLSLIHFAAPVLNVPLAASAAYLLFARSLSSLGFLVFTQIVFAAAFEVAKSLDYMRAIKLLDREVLNRWKSIRYTEIDADAYLKNLKAERPDFFDNMASAMGRIQLPRWTNTTTLFDRKVDVIRIFQLDRGSTGATAEEPTTAFSCRSALFGTFVFTSWPPGNLKSLRRFAILHEAGHCVMAERFFNVFSVSLLAMAIAACVCFLPLARSGASFVTIITCIGTPLLFTRILLRLNDPLHREQAADIFAAANCTPQELSSLQSLLQQVPKLLFDESLGRTEIARKHRNEQRLQHLLRWCATPPNIGAQLVEDLLDQVIIPARDVWIMSVFLLALAAAGAFAGIRLHKEVASIPWGWLISAAATFIVCWQLSLFGTLQRLRRVSARLLTLKPLPISPLDIQARTGVSYSK
jgi:hypothetical protein